jgi:hypothetical protein
MVATAVSSSAAFGHSAFATIRRRRARRGRMAMPAVAAPHAMAIEARALGRDHQGEIRRDADRTRYIQCCALFGQISDHAAEGPAGKFYHPRLQFAPTCDSPFFHHAPVMGAMLREIDEERSRCLGASLRATTGLMQRNKQALFGHRVGAASAFIRATPLSEDPRSPALSLSARPVRSTQIL